jgi:hypothetical protein
LPYPPARRRTLAILAAGLLALVLVAGLAVHPRAAQGYQPRPGDDRPPADTHYAAAMRAGRARDYAGAQAQFLQLAREQHGTSAGAWALYQAALCAKATGDTAGAERLFGELRRDYPEHPLALRLKPDPPTPKKRAPRQNADCGPQSLLALCREAGIPADVQELRGRCGTTGDGTTMEGLLRAAREKGLQAEALQVDAQYLRHWQPKGIAWVQGDHYVAFLPGPTPEELRVHDPGTAGPRTMKVGQLIQQSHGVVLLAAWGRDRLPPLERELR